MVGRSLALIGLALAAGAFASSCKAGAGGDDECPVGSEGCPCTDGGACDPNLSCLSQTCVNPNPTGGMGGSGSSVATSGSAMSTTGSFGTAASSGSGMCSQMGCKKIDVLFALDGSGSMTEEINALSAAQSFQATIQALSSLNCGNIHYRIGVTNDNDSGFLVPNGWSGSVPWFDSDTMNEQDIAAAFAGACAKVASATGHPTGCEHVLSSASSLAVSDVSGFLRPDALLVLVLLTDVDDYGAYDHVGYCSLLPGEGCQQTGAPISQIYSSLTALKGNDPKGVATIAIAGDPNINGGQNFCNQPGTCGCVDMGGGLVDCSIFHADRLWQFAGAQTGMNGFTANLCSGPQSVPDAVEAALTSNIDLACQNYVPPS
jgi:hypothetical protein